jgi:hypothetical protein
MANMIYLILAYSWLLLIGFIFYAGALSAWGNMRIGIKILIAPALIIFFFADVIFDMVAGTILFRELPGWTEKRFTFSQRCEYHWLDAGFNGSVAGAFCFLLNSISKNHCENHK